MSYVVNSLESAKNCYMEILEQWRKGKFLLVTIKQQTRLDIQNRWVHKCYEMVSKQSGNTIPDITNRCKYEFGMPILMVNRQDEAVIWRKMMLPLNDAERYLSMKRMPVTRLFNVKECSSYIEQLIIEYGSEYELPSKDWRG